MFSNSLVKIDGHFTCVCVTFVILLLPLARGGTILWPQALSILVIGLLFLTLVIFNDFSVLKNQLPWLLPWLVLSIFVVIQLIPFRAFDIIEPDPFAIKTRISAMPGETISYWALFTLYWVVAWLVSNLGRRQIIFIVSCIGALLLFEAIYGILAYIKNYEKILGVWYVENYSRVVSGTFVNRNHFSAMFEIASPVVLSLLLMPKLFNKQFNIPFKVCIGLLFLFICTLAVFNAYSRLGLICYFISILTWIILVSNTFSFSSVKNKLALFLFSFLSLAFVIGLWFGLEPILVRFERVDDDTRFELWIHVIKDFPTNYWLWGMGAGTFVDNFRLIAPLELSSRTFYHLHNDWLEFVLDFGIFCAMIIATSFIIWYKKIRSQRYSVLQLGAISGIIGIAVHSFGDFVLQIPGAAIIFWVMVGIVMNNKLAK